MVGRVWHSGGLCSGPGSPCSASGVPALLRYRRGWRHHLCGNGESSRRTAPRCTRPQQRAGSANKKTLLLIKWWHCVHAKLRHQGGFLHWVAYQFPSRGLVGRVSRRRPHSVLPHKLRRQPPCSCSNARTPKDDATERGPEPGHPPCQTLPTRWRATQHHQHTPHALDEKRGL